MCLEFNSPELAAKFHLYKTSETSVELLRFYYEKLVYRNPDVRNCEAGHQTEQQMAPPNMRATYDRNSFPAHSELSTSHRDQHSLNGNGDDQ